MIEISVRKKLRRPRNDRRMPVTEQAQQLIKVVGWDLEKVGLCYPDAGHDGAPAVKRRPHELQVRIIGSGGESQVRPAIALPELVVDDSDRGQPGSPAFVTSRRVAHFETDLLVRLVVPDSESRESPRVDGNGSARRIRGGCVKATRVGWVIADGSLAVQGDEVATKLGIRRDESEKTLHPGRAVVRSLFGFVSDGRSTEPDRDASLSDCLRSSTVQREVVVGRSLPEPPLIRFIPDLEPPVGDRLSTEARVGRELVEEGADECLPAVPSRWWTNWRGGDRWWEEAEARRRDQDAAR